MNQPTMRDLYRDLAERKAGRPEPLRELAARISANLRALTSAAAPAPRPQATSDVPAPPEGEEARQRPAPALSDWPDNPLEGGAI